MFSAQDQCLCPGRTSNTSWVWPGVNGAPGRSAAGSGHTGELLGPRFHTLCSLPITPGLRDQTAQLCFTVKEEVLILLCATPSSQIVQNSALHRCPPEPEPSWNLSVDPSNISLKWTGERARYFKDPIWFPPDQGIMQPQTALTTYSYLATDRESSHSYLFSGRLGGVVLVCEENCVPRRFAELCHTHRRLDRKQGSQQNTKGRNFADFIFLLPQWYS